jgi:hypothetical protein
VAEAGALRRVRLNGFRGALEVSYRADVRLEEDDHLDIRMESFDRGGWYTASSVTLERGQVAYLAGWLSGYADVLDETSSVAQALHQLLEVWAARPVDFARERIYPVAYDHRLRDALDQLMKARDWPPPPADSA